VVRFFLQTSFKQTFFVLEGERTNKIHQKIDFWDFGRAPLRANDCELKNWYTYKIRVGGKRTFIEFAKNFCRFFFYSDLDIFYCRLYFLSNILGDKYYGFRWKVKTTSVLYVKNLWDHQRSKFFSWPPQPYGHFQGLGYYVFYSI
jgi:hypothetical protein